MRLSTLGLAAVILFTAWVAKSDEGDDTLKYFLGKSDLVVLGKITNAPAGITDESGVLNYACRFEAQEVLKGDGTMKGQVINVNIVRLEMGPKDEHPLIKKDGECILFIKNALPKEKEGTPIWVTADFWFGIQHPSPWMARSLKRLAH